MTCKVGARGTAILVSCAPCLAVLPMLPDVTTTEFRSTAMRWCRALAESGRREEIATEHFVSRACTVAQERLENFSSLIEKPRVQLGRL